MKSQLEQHTVSDLHTKNKELQCSKKQVLLAQMQQESGIRNEFFKDLCSAMVAANIPWYKLQMFRSFLKKYSKRQVPDKSTFCKNYLGACYQSVNTKVQLVLCGTYS
jgi:hypothetical protein